MERRSWASREACLERSEHSSLLDSASWDDFIRRSARRIWRESSSWIVFESSVAAAICCGGGGGI